MQTTKIKLRLGGRPLRKSVGVISNVVRTALYGQPGADIPVAQRAQAIRRQQRVVSGSSLTHVNKRKRRLFNKPPPHTKGFGPIQHPVTPRKFTPFTGPAPARKPNTRDAATEIVLHNKLLPKADTFTRSDDKKENQLKR